MEEQSPAQEPSVRTDRLGWLPGLTAVLAFVSCNGTFVLLGLFSLFGVTLVINPHLQAAAIAAFAVLTLILVALDRRKHGRSGPLVTTLLAALIIVGTMYVAYDKTLETLGLLALFFAAIWDWHLVRCTGPSPARR